MNKKGFTLVELLAVIVVLALIAIIAAPIIIKTTNDAKKDTFKDSVYGAMKAAKIALANETFEDLPEIELTFNFTTGNNIKKLDLKGDIPKNGYLTINQEGKIELIITDKKYCAKKEFDNDDVIVEEYDPLTCKTEYEEEILNGADPVLDDEIIPVTIANDGKVTEADITKQWYKYEDHKWANAVILKDGAKVEVDGTIKEESIKEYYVWIPKYAYKLWNVDSNNTNNVGEPIEIIFGEEAKTTGTKNGDTYIHPAFTNFNTNGIWVGKFEVSYDEESYIDNTKFLNKNPNYESATDSSKIIIKPNVRSLTNKNVSSLYTLIKESHKNLNSHMITNMEWGAVAYLTYSKYGRCDDKNCTEVTINNINTGHYVSDSVFEGQWEFGPPITGCAGDTVSADVVSNSRECTNKYNTANGYLASTTGNITGIYDMSGGSWEFVMSVLEDANGNLYSGRNSTYNSGFKGIYGCPTCDSDTSGLTSNTTGIDFPDKKYYNSYVRSDAIGTDIWYDYTAGKLGDATKEVANTKTNNSNERGLWFNDYAHFATPVAPWFRRGGSWSNGSGAGMFLFLRAYGHADSYGSTRSVLAY